MANTLVLEFSHVFPGTVWNMLADTGDRRIYVEVRDAVKKEVSFSALNLQNYQWFWKDITFEERWWISLAAVANDVLLFTLYTDTGNPDKKSLLAYHVLENRLLWWQNGFSLAMAAAGQVRGVDARFPAKETVLDLFTGKPVGQADFHLADSQNFPVIRPFQYEEGTDYFGTVRQFLQTRVRTAPVATVEYLEYEGLILVSAFEKDDGLANYLYAFNSSGELLMKEILGENLKGVGLDTFFIYSRHLIFVRNKNELRSYKIL